jgi:hypothetical protein
MVRLAYPLVMGYTLWVLLSEFFAAPVVFFSIAAVSRASAVISLITIVFVPRGYLAVGAVVVVIAGSPPLATVSVSSVVLW